MGRAEFIEELKSCVGEVHEHGDGKASFLFIPEVGRLKGQQFKIGYEIPPDFNATPPSGVHVSPRIYPNQSGGTHPAGGISDSALGSEWHFWSRSMPHWPQTKRTVKDVLAHLRRLFATL